MLLSKHILIFRFKYQMAMIAMNSDITLRLYQAQHFLDLICIRIDNDGDHYKAYFSSHIRHHT